MRTLKAKTQSEKNLLEKGFTLVEMAIVTTIVGLIIASAATAYVQWQTWLRYEITKNNIDAVHLAIEDFLGTNGRYPCPSSLQATRTDGSLYGLEPVAGSPADCNTVLAVDQNLAGDATNDLFIMAGFRAVDEYIDNTGTLQGAGPGTVTPQIRVGMVPFRSLGLQENQAFDGYRNRIYYAVTEHMTSSVGFDNGTTGTIRIDDDNGQSLTNTPGNVHFLVFSAGENGAGAFNREGTLTACPAAAGALENENCDFTLAAGDGVFRQGQYSSSTGVNAMDDRVAFGVSEVPYFERPVGAGSGLPGSGDLDDGVTKSAASLGIGAIKDNPAEELDVAGIVRAQAPDDDPLTTFDESTLGGKVEASELCESGTDVDCFEIEAIAGALADGDGMECPAGTFITGIQNNSPNCSVIETGCSGNEIIIGIDADGNAICSGSTGNPSCPTTQIPVCGVNQTAAFGVHGTIRQLTGGINRVEDWECNNGTWQLASSSGVCTCTPTPPVTGSRRCSIRSSCNIQFNGTETYQRVAETCAPPGTGTTTILSQAGCVCNPTPRTAGRNCSGANSFWLGFVPTSLPSGYSFNTGRINIERRTQCPATTCTPWTLDSEDCGCSPQTQTQTNACTNGYTGNRTRTRNFACAGGGGVGDYGQWTPFSAWDETACTCDTTPVITVVRCRDRAVGWVEKPSNPYGGIRVETVKLDTGTACVTQPPTDLDTLTAACDPPPPVQCAWSAGGSPQPGAHPVNSVGGICACGSANDACSQGGVLHPDCSCDPI